MKFGFFSKSAIIVLFFFFIVLTDMFIGDNVFGLSVIFVLSMFLGFLIAKFIK
jgi:hypothetical protein